MENNKKLIVLIVALSLIVIGLGGYIVYDKVINEKEEPKSTDIGKPSEEENKNMTTSCGLEDLNGEILNFPTNNDSDVVVSDGKYEYNNYFINFSYNPDSEDYYTDYYYLEIKDKNGKIVYSNNYVKTEITGSICDGKDYSMGKTLKTVPTISNGKLYFVSISNTCYKYDEDFEFPYYSYNYVDLKGDASKIVNVQNMKLMMEGAAPDDLQCEGAE